MPGNGISIGKQSRMVIIRRVNRLSAGSLAIFVNIDAAADLRANGAGLICFINV